ncbi:MAG: hypothetical protein NZ528_09055 [Caldilineales bacterium]|nr:hypothetical protein [Caldilineales bacterium]MDW8319430.1 hypothetical protein [Anaerolineae bacterium]
MARMPLAPVRAGSLPAGERTDREAARTRSALLPTLLALLVAAALVDWLVTRTLTRLAIFVPKTPPMITAYQGLNWLGLAGSTLAGLAALAVVVLIAVREGRSRQGLWLAVALTGLAGLTVLVPLLPAGSWLPAIHGLTLLALGGLAVRSARLNGGWPRRLAALLPALAMLAAALSQAGPILYSLLRLPGPPRWGLPLFHLGEALVLLGALALWWAYGRGAARRYWLAAALPALLFLLAYRAAPAMTATIVVWSHGLTLSLAAWWYALALWLFGATVLRSLHGRHSSPPTAVALLLLAAAGYAPQLTAQLCFGLIALWLLTHDPQRACGR